MKLGEIKIEALKLMFAGNGNDFNDPDISQLGYMKNMPEYRDYLGSMNGSINRCFAILEEKRVLPIKSRVLGKGNRHKLDELGIEDFFDIERIVFEGDGIYEGNCEFYREGDLIIIRNYDKDGEYRLLYKPSLPRVTSGTDEKTELPIPDRIACHIPYYIKSELFRMDEPAEASEARNFFEAAMEQISRGESGSVSRVAHSYSVYEV